MDYKELTKELRAGIQGHNTDDNHWIRLYNKAKSFFDGDHPKDEIDYVEANAPLEAIYMIYDGIARRKGLR